METQPVRLRPAAVPEWEAEDLLAGRLAGGVAAATAGQAVEMLSQVRLSLPVDILQTDDDLHRMVDEIEGWVRWRRLPGYWLAHLFQRVTFRTKSPYHPVACRLYAQAQAHLNEDLAVASLENAYNVLVQLLAAGGTEPLRRVAADLEARLADYHRYYAQWCKPFDYLVCNPLSDHPYSLTTASDLRLNFPELATDVARSDPRILLSVLEQCHDEVVYYRILMRRFLGSLYQGRGELEAALEQFRVGLDEARHVGLDAEIGHLHRLYGHALHMAGQLAAAAEQYKQALDHDSGEYFAYWQALSARELGDVRAKMAVARRVDFSQQPSALQPALDAYRVGRRLFEAHLASQTLLPIARGVKQQMFRSFTDNALQVASIVDSAQDVLAELEANGPREATEVVVEMVAVQTIQADSKQEFRRLREVFHHHLTTVPEHFADYLAALPAEHQVRQRYLESRVAMTTEIGRAEFADDVVRNILDLRLPGVVFLLFNLGWQRSSVVFVDMAAGQVIERRADFNERQIRTLHQEYSQALATADSLPDPGVYARQALDRLLAAYGEFLNPFWSRSCLSSTGGASRYFRASACMPCRSTPCASVGSRCLSTARSAMDRPSDYSCNSTRNRQQRRLARSPWCMTIRASGGSREPSVK